MTTPTVPDDITTAASVVAMHILSNHLTQWQYHLDGYVMSPFRDLKDVSDENWQLVLTAIKQTAETMMPEPKLYDSALKTLQETAQNVAAATEGVN